MVERKRAFFFWRILIVILILAAVGGMSFVLVQFSSGAWTLFPTLTPTATFTPTPVIPTATLFVPSDTPTVTPSPTRSGPITYTVVSGDTLFGIADTYEVDVQTLIAYNGLTSPDLSVGQQLVIPPPGFVFEIPTATPIPTGLRPGTVITYTIQVGDVLSLIAERFGARLDDVMIVNGITDPNNIQVGETIRIPYNSLTGTPITPTRTPRPTNTRRP
ncbi:MAG: LysM peptidoglycan-binding domain-containing protein [Chloroflexi bacterium]|nr:LysM peptidoglycan-binding domain-containing protein [Chloroflexota bacterium]